MNINIYDSTLTFKGVIDDAESFIPDLYHGGRSKAVISIEANKNHVEHLVKGAFFIDSEDRDHVFCITKREPDKDREGEYLQILGYDIMWIFRGRTSNTGTAAVSYSSKSVEYIIKNLLDAAVVNPTDSDRDISIINVLTNNDKGSTIDCQVEQTLLEDDIKYLLAIDSLGIKGTLNSSTKKIDVDVYEGEDRSVNNTDSNDPVMFSVKYDNLISSSEIDDITAMTNFAYVLGVDTDGSRKVAEYGTATGIDRREVVIDGGDVSDTTELQTIGKANLQAGEKSFSVDADAINGPFVYDEDFTLGDIVTVAGEDLRLVRVTKVYQAGSSKKILLTFGSVETTIESQVKSNSVRIGNLEVKLANTSLDEAATLVAETTISSDADTISISGLDLSSDGGVYDFVIYGDIDTSNSFVYMYFNGDTTVTNYYSQRLVLNGTTVSGIRSNFPSMTFAATGEGFYIKGTVFLEAISDHLRADTVSGAGTASTPISRRCSIVHNSTQTNLTSLTFYNANNFLAGTTVKVYKRGA